MEVLSLRARSTYCTLVAQGCTGMTNVQSHSKGCGKLLQSQNTECLRGKAFMHCMRFGPFDAHLQVFHEQLKG